MKRFLSVIMMFAFAAALVSCNADAPSDNESSEDITASVTAQPTTAQPTTMSQQEIAEIKIDDMLSEMTVEEKVGQMFFVRCPDTDAADTVSKYHLGGYMLFGRDFDEKTKDEITDNIKRYQNNSEIPLLIGVDEEGGSVVRVSSNQNLRNTPFLSPRDTYNNGGWEAIDSDANEKAELLLSLGINVNLAPVCDLTFDPDAFMYDRSFSGDVDMTCNFVKRVVEISKNKKLGTVLKHFPGYGNNSDTHTAVAYDNREYSEFENADFKPFETGITCGADSILVSHNIVKCMDSEYPASLSPKVHNIIRENLGFDGVIMTDDLSMEAITDYTGADTAAVFAAKNGNDIICCTDVEVQYPAVLTAIKNNEIPLEQINESVKRILKWKQKLGLLE